MPPQSHFTLFRSLQVQPKQRLRQTAASGNQEKRGERRKKEVKDSGLKDLSRMDVKEVSAFKTDMQPSSVVSQYLNIDPVTQFCGWEYAAFIIYYSISLWTELFGFSSQCSVMDLLPHRLMCLITD